MSTIINLEITEFFLPSNILYKIKFFKDNLEEEGIRLVFKYNDVQYENQVK